MTDKELRKLSRAELLTLLIEVTEENERLSAILARRGLQDAGAGTGTSDAMTEDVQGVFHSLEDTAVGFLKEAREISDQIILEAQERADNMIAEARQQAGRISGGEYTEEAPVSSAPEAASPINEDAMELPWRDHTEAASESTAEVPAPELVEGTEESEAATVLQEAADTLAEAEEVLSEIERELAEEEMGSTSSAPVPETIPEPVEGVEEPEAAEVIYADAEEQPTEARQGAVEDIVFAEVDNFEAAPESIPVPVPELVEGVEGTGAAGFDDIREVTYEQHAKAEAASAPADAELTAAAADAAQAVTETADAQEEEYVLPWLRQSQTDKVATHPAPVKPVNEESVKEALEELREVTVADEQAGASVTQTVQAPAPAAAQPAPVTAATTAPAAAGTSAGSAMQPQTGTPATAESAQPAPQKPLTAIDMLRMMQQQQGGGK